MGFRFKMQEISVVWLWLPAWSNSVSDIFSKASLGVWDWKPESLWIPVYTRSERGFKSSEK